VDPKAEEDKKLSRAQRFGDAAPKPLLKAYGSVGKGKDRANEEARAAVVVDPEEEAKRKARAMRFAMQ